MRRHGIVADSWLALGKRIRTEDLFEDETMNQPTSNSRLEGNEKQAHLLDRMEIFVAELQGLDSKLPSGLVLIMFFS